jgi:hypothetical protein
VAWRLNTTDQRPDGIFSALYSDETRLGVTLEHAYEDADGNWRPKLPRGATYRCRRGMHRLSHYNKGEPFETFEVMDVPGHSGILFHPGNFNRDSDGCLLTGSELKTESSEWWVTQSSATFRRFMQTLSGIDEFELTVE